MTERAKRRRRMRCTVPRSVTRLLLTVSRYLERQMQPPPACEPQRDIDHRVQARILPGVRTIGGSLLWNERRQHGKST